MNWIHLLNITSLFLFFASCQQSTNDTELAEIDPSIEVPVVRYEKKLAALTTDRAPAQYAELLRDHPAFTEIFMHHVFALPHDSARVVAELKAIAQDTNFHNLLNEVESEYPELSTIMPEVNQVIENFLMLTGRKEPTIYTFVSGFVYQCFLFDNKGQDGIGIGLDMFLGQDFPYKNVDPKNPVFSSYLTRSYSREYIPIKVAQILVEDILPPVRKSDFINHMIYGGKKLYLMDHLLNFKPDHMVMEYTPEQYQWCQENEVQIWDFFFDKKLFYETDIRKFNKYIGPSPDAPGMPKEAPGRTANYIGWQIVKSYMANHPNTTIQDLIELKDAQQLMDDSRFKPQLVK